MKVVYVFSEGVLGIIQSEYPDSVIRTVYFIDGMRYDTILEEDEYFLIEGENE